MDEISIIDDPGNITSANFDANGNFYNPNDSGTNPSPAWLASLFGNGFNSQNDNSALFQQYMQFIRDNTNYNNSWSAEQAEKQMNFQDLQRRYAELYNSREAAKNRDWQEFMSNTAHQREVADLKAAGLNPVLSATGGNGAAIGSGASASIGQAQGSKGETDESANMAITSLLGGFLSSMMNLEGQRINAQASMAVAEKYTAMEKMVQEMKQEYGRWEHENYPSSLYEAISALIKGLTGDDFNTRAGNTARNFTDLWDLFKSNFTNEKSTGFAGSSGNIDSGRSKAHKDYDKPWWQKFTEAFGMQ